MGKNGNILGIWNGEIRDLADTKYLKPHWAHFDSKGILSPCLWLLLEALLMTSHEIVALQVDASSPHTPSPSHYIQTYESCYVPRDQLKSDIT